MAKKLSTFYYMAVILVVIYLVATLPQRIEKRNAFWGQFFREGMVNKTCPDGTRTDGPCLLEFPSV